jgi:hypothetical protein
MGNMAWSERLATAGDPERSAHHVWWAFIAHYGQHMSSMFQEVTVTGSY